MCGTVRHKHFCTVYACAAFQITSLYRYILKVVVGLMVLIFPLRYIMAENRQDVLGIAGETN